MQKRRIRDYGVTIGALPTGVRNQITDVSGVLVGHATIDTETNKTGVTIIMPREQNVFKTKCVASSYVLNGYGKSLGLVQVDELGTLETPIALTNTLNVGLVHDALVEYTIQRSFREQLAVGSLNPVVGETNDGYLNGIHCRAVRQAHVFAAIKSASTQFTEGDVGAGKGTICYGFKGGIGSSSRIMHLGGRDYTMGVLVQSNFGVTGDLIVAGHYLGEKACKYLKPRIVSEDQGSIMVVMATDLPLSSRQLRRILKRGAVGLARTGSYIGNESGDVFIGFSTANGQAPSADSDEIFTVHALHEDCLTLPLRAMAECTEEAVLNSMTMAGTVKNGQGKTIHAISDFLEDISFPCGH